MSTAVSPIVSHAPTKPVDVMPHLQQVSRQSCTICSIWPQPRFGRRKHNGITYYHLPAAPRGSYATLTVYDTQQWINMPNERSYQGSIEPRPLQARVVANCLVSEWGGDTIGARSGFKPGIFIIAGDVPTAEELAVARASQSNLFNWLITDGNGKHMSGEGVNISDMHRMAAKHQLDRGADRLPWFHVYDFAEVKDCVACGRQIIAKAIRCEHCTTMLPDFYESYGLDVAADPAVADFVKRVGTPKGESAKNPRTAGQPKA